VVPPKKPELGVKIDTDEVIDGFKNKVEFKRHLILQ